MIIMGKDKTLKINGVKIRPVDVGTPTIYSLQWIDEYARRWEVLLERVGWTYMLRQVLVLDNEDYVLYDVTLRPECLRVVKERIKGFTSDSKILTWNDMMIDMKNKEVI